MRFYSSCWKLLLVGFFFLSTTTPSTPLGPNRQLLEERAKSPKSAKLTTRPSATDAQMAKATPVDLLQYAKRAEAIAGSKEVQATLTPEQRIVLLVNNYNVLLLRGRVPEAHQSLSGAVDLASQIKDPADRAHFDLEFTVLAALDPQAEKFPADFRTKYLPLHLEGSIPADNKSVMTGSPEWALKELATDLRIFSFVDSPIKIGNSISTFTGLFDSMMKTYPDPQGLSTDAYLRCLAAVNVLLAYERYIVHVNQHVLEIKRETQDEPFSSGMEAYQQAFAYFTPVAKRQLLENNLVWTDAVISLEDARGASLLAEFNRRLLAIPGQPFEGRDALQKRLEQFDLKLPYLLTLQESYGRLRSGQIQPATVLLRGELPKIQMIADPLVRDEVLGLFHRSRARIELVSGDVKEAQADYQKSIALLERLDHLAALGVWGELAQAWAAAGDYKQAQANLGHGFTLRDKLLNKYDSTAVGEQAATLYVVQVVVHYLAGDYDKMKADLDEAIPIFEGFERAVLNNPETLATLYTHRGLFEVAKNKDCSAAMENFEKALDGIGESAQTPLTEVLHLKMGKCQDQLGNQEDAVKSLKTALMINRQLRKAARGSAAYELLLGRSPFEEIQNALHNVLFDLLQKRGFTSTALAQELFFYGELSKSRGIVDEIESMRQGIVFVNPEGADETLRGLSSILGELIPLRPTAAGAPATISSVFAQQQEFICQMSVRHHREAVMLEYLPVEQRDRGILFIVSGRSATWVLLKTPWSQIVKSVAEFRRDIKESLEQYAELRKSPRPDAAVVQRIKELEREINEQSHALSRMLFPQDVPALGNLQEYIANKSVILVPHGELHNLPFVALRMDTAGEPRYLIDVVGRLTTVPSATVLRSVVSLYKSNLEQPVSSVLLVGDPESVDLPAVGGEFQGITQAIGVTSSTFERKGIEQAVRSNPAVHFAVHAFFNRDNLARSGLSLKDGTWNLSEIAMVAAKKTRLVTMGACESGEAGVLPGDEVWGLANAFMFAGVPAVVGSLWDQDDEASRIFFTTFYSHMRNRSDVGAAFHTAMLDVRKSSEVAAAITDIPGLQGSSNPCFWAGFNFIGE